jgi:hypothetical protein
VAQRDRIADFPRYRILFSETAASLAAAQIEVWWLDQVGTVLDA